MYILIGFCIIRIGTGDIIDRAALFYVNMAKKEDEV